MSKQESQFIYAFETELCGYINLDEPGGKYNVCSFQFTLPEEVIDLAEKDRDELLDVARSKVQHPNRLATNPPKWSSEGRVKYNFGGDTIRISPVVIDEYGDPFPTNLIKWEGTKVQILMEQKPIGNPIGTTVVYIRSEMNPDGRF